MNVKKYEPEYFIYLVAIFLGICTFQVYSMMHTSNFSALTLASSGVVEGKPYWIAYQNRLLGPYLVLGISMIGCSYEIALKAFTLLLIILESLVLLRMMRMVQVSQKQSLWYLVAFLFAFLTLQDYWFYTWDSIDLLIFTFFSFGIIEGKKAAYFLVLFIIALLNRETALFIAVYLMLDAFLININKKIVALKNPKQFLFGLLLLITGLVYVKVLRHLLFISKTDGNPDTEHELIGNHIYFFNNVTDMFFNNLFNINIIYSVGIIFCITYFVYNIKRYSGTALKCFIMLILLFLNILIFGIFNEARMHFILLPFFLFLSIHLSDNHACEE
ncbi:MAG: hypothetical protein WCG19_08685 [Chlorobiaceae bacterium]